MICKCQHVTMGIVFAASFGTGGAQNSPGSAAIDASLRGAVERKDVPGVVALVTDRQRVLYQGAFGAADVATGRALAADALFRIASMTKVVTSLAAMQLVEQGRFGLDDPVEKYLPEFAGLKVFESFDPATGEYRLRPASRPPTVRHVLTHTSGLAYPFTSATWRDFKPRAGETHPFGGPLLFDPGERWHYSTSTDVVGRLGSLGPKARGLFPPAHLCPSRDARHVLQRAAGQGGAPRRRAAARRRPHGWCHRTVDAAAGAHDPGADRRRPCLDRRHQQYLLLDRSEPRHCGRDIDAVPAVRRRQGVGRLRWVRARRLSARERDAVAICDVMAGMHHADQLVRRYS